MLPQLDQDEKLFENELNYSERIDDIKSRSVK